MAVTVHFGLGGIFRDILINTADIVSAYACSEIADTVAHDIAFGRNPGTWVNASGCTRGVAGDLPEGNLACLFDGVGYIRVPNDGDGYYLPGDSAGRNLSCAGGDIDVISLVKITTNDATPRIIAGKYDLATGNGWAVFYQGGTASFILVKAGVAIFNLQAGAIATGTWMLFHATYDTVTGVARNFLNGVQQGSVSVAPGIEPPLTTVDMLIGRLSDGSDVCLDTISYVGIGRNGNLGLSALLQATRSWTDVSADVRTDPPELSSGIQGRTFKDRLASIGTFTFVLNNAATLGKYTIGHANQRAGFGLGIPVKVTDGSMIRFRGRLTNADPEPGLYGQKRVFAVAGDWFVAAARTSIHDLPIRLDIRSDQAWALIVDQADYPPPAVSITAGSETFPFFGDVVGEDAMEEIRKVTESEGGYCYIAPDAVTGGVLTFEPRGVRQLDTTIDATFTSAMRMLALPVSVSDGVVINRVSGQLTVRRPGPSATAILVQHTERQRIVSGDTLRAEGRYQDPSQSRSDIGGTDFQPFTAGTDYTFTQNEDGTGLDWTTDLQIVASIGGSGYEIQFTNTGAQPGWLAFQIRGRALYTDRPFLVKVEDESSIRAQGLRPETITFDYLNDVASARNLAQLPVSLFSSPVKVPPSVMFRCHPTSALATTLAGLTIGSRVAPTESMTALTTATALWVQSERRVYLEGGLLEVTLGLFPCFAGGDDPFAAWDETDWDESLWGF